MVGVVQRREGWWPCGERLAPSIFRSAAPRRCRPGRGALSFRRHSVSDIMQAGSTSSRQRRWATYRDPSPETRGPNLELSALQAALRPALLRRLALPMGVGNSQQPAGRRARPLSGCRISGRCPCRDRETRLARVAPSGMIDPPTARSVGDLGPDCLGKRVPGEEIAHRIDGGQRERGPRSCDGLGR